MPGSSRSVGEHRSRNRRPIFPTGHKIPRSRASCGYCIPLSILHSEVDPHVKKCKERVHVENAGRYGSGGVTSAQRNYRRGKGQCWARHTESSQCSPESPTWAHAPSGILGPGQAGRTRVLHLHPDRSSASGPSWHDWSHATSSLATFFTPSQSILAFQPDKHVLPPMFPYSWIRPPTIEGPVTASGLVRCSRFWDQVRGTTVATTLMGKPPCSQGCLLLYPGALPLHFLHPLGRDTLPELGRSATLSCMDFCTTLDPRVNISSWLFRAPRPREGLFGLTGPPRVTPSVHRWTAAAVETYPQRRTTRTSRSPEPSYTRSDPSWCKQPSTFSLLLQCRARPRRSLRDTGYTVISAAPRWL